MLRLRNRSQFQAVMASAPVAKTEHFALHRAPLSRANARSQDGRALFPVVDQAWVGVVQPKRCAKRAVTRNTLRRQIYAVAADLGENLPADAWVVRLKAPFSRQQFISSTSVALKQAAREELGQLFSRGLERLQQKDQAGREADTGGAAHVA
ncbi:hypothetical protein NBRC116584_21070 [Hydrogenophaga sp. 5NK40-0174]